MCYIKRTVQTGTNRQLNSAPFFQKLSYRPGDAPVPPGYAYAFLPTTIKNFSKRIVQRLSFRSIQQAVAFHKVYNEASLRYWIEYNIY